MLKKNVIKVIGETAMRVDPNLTREEKFQVFCNVVDGGDVGTLFDIVESPNSFCRSTAVVSEFRMIATPNA